jgi:hypothetical protein
MSIAEIIIHLQNIFKAKAKLEISDSTSNMFETSTYMHGTYYGNYSESIYITDSEAIKPTMLMNLIMSLNEHHSISMSESDIDVLWSLLPKSK